MLPKHNLASFALRKIVKSLQIKGSGPSSSVPYIALPLRTFKNELWPIQHNVCITKEMPCYVVQFYFNLSHPALGYNY